MHRTRRGIRAGQHDGGEGRGGRAAEISEERDGPGDIPAPSATSPGAVGDARGQHPEHPTKTP